MQILDLSTFLKKVKISGEKNHIYFTRDNIKKI